MRADDAISREIISGWLRTLVVDAVLARYESTLQTG